MSETRDLILSRHEEINDDEARILIEEYIFRNNDLKYYSLKEKIQLIERIFNGLRKDLDILQPYQNNLDISEIMVNGKDDIFVERNGRLERIPVSFEKTEDLEELIRRIAAKVYREINELNPIVDARLSDGSRINAVYKNIALGGPILTIRKFPEKAITMDNMIEWGTITEEIANFLIDSVRAGLNIFISGGTSSGKTTFLNVLSNFIPGNERVIVIEDSAELQIRSVENLVRMECRNANVQGKGEVDLQSLIKTSLRMRPDRIIVGEVRGKEVIDMIQAMNTGHDGSLCTGHGNSITGMLRRLESMYLQAAKYPIEVVRSQIAEGLDLMIHLGRLCDGSRKVLEIAEICGVDSNEFVINRLYCYKPGAGFMSTGNKLSDYSKFELRGMEINGC